MKRETGMSTEIKRAGKMRPQTAKVRGAKDSMSKVQRGLGEDLDSMIGLTSCNDDPTV